MHESGGGRLCTCSQGISRLDLIKDSPCLDTIKNNSPSPSIKDAADLTWTERVHNLKGLPQNIKDALIRTVPDSWTWNHHDKSDEVMLYGPRNSVALFHPGWSNGTAAVRGNKPINKGSGVVYWEVDLSHRVFGSALMLGIGSKSCRLYREYFAPLLGSDEHSCGLSHHGIAYRNGHSMQVCDAFPEFSASKVSMVYDQRMGDLYYLKDGVALNMGQPVFTGLHNVGVPLYPMLSSTASRSEMQLVITRRSLPTLQSLCIEQIAHNYSVNPNTRLNLPQHLLSRVYSAINT